MKVIVGRETGRLTRLDHFLPDHHPNQRQSVEKDGSYLLETPYADDHELVMEILSHGPDVEVLAPAALRKPVAESPTEAARCYE